MFNITKMAILLADELNWQSTPLPIYKEDFVRIVILALKKYYVDCNHPESYNRELYTTDADGSECYDYDFNVLEEEYIYILCKLKFYQKVYSSASGDKAISYTTDALSVTGAKEGYKSIQAILDDLERERLRVFHKLMAREQG